MGSAQSRKFSEIAQLLKERGKFILSYTNFGHHDKYVFEAFSNVQPIRRLPGRAVCYFTIDVCFPASHNWHGGQPNRKLIKAAEHASECRYSLHQPKAGRGIFLHLFPR